MGLFAAVIAERIGVRAGMALLAPLVVARPRERAVVAWRRGAGHGDLRPYALVQFYPLVAVPLILYLFGSRYTLGGAVLTTLAVYGLAECGGAAVTEATPVSVVHRHRAHQVQEEIRSNWTPRQTSAAALGRVIGPLKPPTAQSICLALTAEPRALEKGEAASVVRLTARNRLGHPVGGFQFVRVARPSTSRLEPTVRAWCGSP